MAWSTNHIIRTVLKLVAALLGVDVEEPEVSLDERPARRVQDSFDAPTIEIFVHSTPALRKRNGLWPEKKATQLLANALDDAALNYEIEWGYEEVFDPPTESPYDKDFATVNWWVDNYLLNGDAALLLTDGAGGVSLGSHCVAGGKSITADVEVTATKPGRDSSGLHAIGHEVGHSLGVGADADPDEPGSQTYGRSWTENGYWHRTLVVSTDDQEENACGEAIETNDEGLPVMHHNRYAECAVRRITEAHPDD